MKCELCKAVITQKQADKGNDVRESKVGEGNNSQTLCADCAKSLNDSDE